MKTRTVLVKCLIVDSDGYAVDGNGRILRSNERGFYEWQKRRKSTKWLANAANKRLWKEVVR